MNILDYIDKLINEGYSEEDAEAAADCMFSEEPFEYDCGFEEVESYEC